MTCAPFRPHDRLGGHQDCRIKCIFGIFSYCSVLVHVRILAIIPIRRGCCTLRGTIRTIRLFSTALLILVVRVGIRVRVHLVAEATKASGASSVLCTRACPGRSPFLSSFEELVRSRVGVPLVVWESEVPVCASVVDRLRVRHFDVHSSSCPDPSSAFLHLFRVVGIISCTFARSASVPCCSSKVFQASNSSARCRSANGRNLSPRVHSRPPFRRACADPCTPSRRLLGRWQGPLLRLRFRCHLRPPRLQARRLP